jgi:hypothetical protein
MAGLCLIVFALLIMARRENHELQLQVRLARGRLHHTGIVAPGVRQPPTGARPATKLPDELPIGAAELEPVLIRLYRTWPSSASTVWKVVNRIAASDLPRALAIISALPIGNPRAEISFSLLRRWAIVDPLEAANAVSTLPAQQTDHGRSIVEAVWAGSDPVAAMAYFGPTNTVIAAYAERFPEQAARVAMAQQRADLRYRAVESVAKAWFAKDPAAAWAWATGLPEIARGYAIRPLVPAMAQVDPASMAAFLAAQTPMTIEPLFQDIGIVADAFAAKDPSAAAQWATNLPARKVYQDAAIDGVVRIWAAQDPPAAAKWIANLTEPDRSREIWAFFAVPGNLEPDLVNALAKGTSDAQLRQRIDDGVRDGDNHISPR